METDVGAADRDHGLAQADPSRVAPRGTLADRFDASRHVLRSTVDDDGVMLVTIAGALDSVTDSALRDVLLVGRAARVELDLSGVSFIGCSTLTVLLQIREALAPRGRTISIRCASEVVHRVLTIAGLTDLLTT